MAVLLALITAASYGVGDFSGGLAARRAAPLSVTATAHALGLVGITLLAAVVGADLVRRATRPADRRGRSELVRHRLGPVLGGDGRDDGDQQCRNAVR